MSTSKSTIGSLALILAWAVWLPVSTQANSFVRVPQLDGKDTGLKMRVIKYTGGTNGKMVVDINNPSKSKKRFQSKGVYFVPETDPEKAPQRVGAAGPFEVTGEKEPKESLEIQPGDTKRITLQVFCIDSHRSSPGANAKFRVAEKRMPKALRDKIGSRTDKVMKRYGSKSLSTASAKSSAQQEVWRSRDEAWLKLEGERKQEKRSPAASSRRAIY